MITIRFATPENDRQILDIYSPIVLDTPISFEYEVPSVQEMRGRIEKTLVHFPWLVCDFDGVAAGYAYAGQHRVRAAYQWSADVSVYVHSDYRRHGIGRALYTALFELLVLQGYYNTYAGITLPNPASVGLHESVGFKPLGVYHAVGYKHGQWYDVGWWERPLQPRTLEPKAPRSIHNVSVESMSKALAVGVGLVRDP
jgi:phosphinothricin acetyltransferase